MRAIKSIALLTGLTIALYLVIDIGFGCLVPMPKSYFETQRLQAAAYQGEAYFSPQFVAESMVQPGGWETPEGTVMVLPREFHGHFFNVDTLPPTGFTYRRTANPPLAKPCLTVLLLGGSTLYNSEVPDDLTVASQLSRLLNREGRAFQVINAGVTTVNTKQEAERLTFELKRGLHPDLVVSLNGVNDIIQGVYYANPDGQIFSRLAIQSSHLVERLPHHIFTWFRLRGEFRAIADQKRVAPQAMESPSALDDLQQRTAQAYSDNLVKMNGAARQAGARFVSFLQPSLFSSDLNEEDADVKQARALAAAAWPKLDRAFAASMPGLRGVVGQLQAEKLDLYDISDAYSHKREQIFLDFCHVNSRGNALLAQRMAPVILELSRPEAGK